MAKNTGKKPEDKKSKETNSEKNEVVEEKDADKVVEKKEKKTVTRNPAELEEDSLKISALLAELIGTFILTGAVIKLVQQGTIGTIGISFILMLLVLFLTPLSESYFNPAVTIGLLINRKIDAVKAIAYIIAQIIGALLALLIFHALWKSGLQSALTNALQQQGYSSQVQQAGGISKFAASQNMTLEQMAKSLGLGFIDMAVAKGGEWVAFAAEVLGTFIFGLGIGHAVYADKKPMMEKGFSAGFALFGGLVIGGSTAILNPAVATAIGAFEWGKGLGSMTFWAPILIYVVGSILGMTIGITAYRYLREKALDVNVF